MIDPLLGWVFCRLTLEVIIKYNCW